MAMPKLQRNQNLEGLYVVPLSLQFYALKFYSALYNRLHFTLCYYAERRSANPNILIATRIALDRVDEALKRIDRSSM